MRQAYGSLVRFENQRLDAVPLQAIIMNKKDVIHIRPVAGHLTLPERSLVLARLTLFILLSVTTGMAAGWLKTQDEATIEGTLKFIAEKATLQTSGTALQLTSANESLAAVLGDSRLEGRVLRVTGRMAKQGVLEVQDFFVVRQGKVYRVIYHCEVCNITTFTPGDCMCCRAPTQLIEVPPTDPRIRLENPLGEGGERSPR